MERLNERDFTKIFAALLGIPVPEARDYALPIARKWVAAYQAGELMMTEKQFSNLSEGIKPMTGDR